nr:hypothetical protein GCM10020092_093540 [Actinoplanes digitatis]
MQGALTRYRIIAWIVGVVLIVLVVVGMPLKYIGDDDTVVAAVGPFHGFLYMLYLAATFDLSRRVGWPLRRMLLVMLAQHGPVLLVLGRTGRHAQVGRRGRRRPTRHGGVGKKSRCESALSPPAIRIIPMFVIIGASHSSGSCVNAERR